MIKGALIIFSIIQRGLIVGLEKLQMPLLTCKTPNICNNVIRLVLLRNKKARGLVQGQAEGGIRQ